MVLSYRNLFAPKSNRVKGESGRIPIPMGGVNSYDPIGRMGPEFMPYAYNVYSSEEGLYTRPGYRRWCTSIGSGAEIRTIIPYHGTAETGSNDELFCVTPDGIYDVSASADNPTIDTSFSTTSGNAGWCVVQQYTNDAGAERLLMADGENGYYEYQQGTGWSTVSGLTGVTAGDVRFVVQHKLRVWLFTEDSAVGYYLPVGAYTGSATSFNFAAQFPNGGYIVGGWSWTLDGGEGADDYFVVLSSSGDVVVYRGNDPSSASTWDVVGRWNIGPLPQGRNLAHMIGGELHLLSKYGIIALNDLLRGTSLEKVTGQTSIARNVVKPIREDMTSRNGYGWSFVPALSEGFVLITRPILSDSDTNLQYAFNIGNPGWGFFRGIPMQCGADYDGTFYFGDNSGNVYYFTGSLDDVLRDGTGGSEVEFSFLTAYNDLGSPAINKIGHFIRPTFRVDSGATPAYNFKFRYDYDLSEPTLGGSSVGISGELWDTAVWDTAIWGASGLLDSQLFGGCGIGRVVAVACKGQAAARTRLIDLEVMFQAAGRGGFL